MVSTGKLGRGKMVWDVLLVGGDILRGRVGVDTRLYSTADAACTDRENVSAWNSAAEMQGYYYARSGKATCKSRVPSQKRNKDAADGIFYEYASPHQAPQCRMTRHSAVARHLTCSHVNHTCDFSLKIFSSLRLSQSVLKSGVREKVFRAVIGRQQSERAETKVKCFSRHGQGD